MLLYNIIYLFIFNINQSHFLIKLYLPAFKQFSSTIHQRREEENPDIQTLSTSSFIKLKSVQPDLLIKRDGGGERGKEWRPELTSSLLCRLPSAGDCKSLQKFARSTETVSLEPLEKSAKRRKRKKSETRERRELQICKTRNTSKSVNSLKYHNLSRFLHI